MTSTTRMTTKHTLTVSTADNNFTNGKTANWTTSKPHILFLRILLRMPFGHVSADIASWLARIWAVNHTYDMCMLPNHPGFPWIIQENPGWSRAPGNSRNIFTGKINLLIYPGKRRKSPFFLHWNAILPALSGSQAQGVVNTWHFTTSYMSIIRYLSTCISATWFYWITVLSCATMHLE